MKEFDLLGAEVKVIGNAGDLHLFRLSNSVVDPVITDGATYEADFTSHLFVTSTVALNTTDIATGILVVPVLIRTGVYRVRRIEPRRTILTIDVESR